jgi:hypothetical protein
MPKPDWRMVIQEKCKDVVKSPSQREIFWDLGQNMGEEGQ